MLHLTKKMCVKLCFLFILCLTMLSYSNSVHPQEEHEDIENNSADILVQLENVVRYVQINENINSYIKDVTIENNSEICSILYKYDLKTKEQTAPKLYAFYTGVGCKFATWTMKIINDFVESSRFFYGDLVENIFNYLGALLSFVDKYVERFINILNNYLDINSHQSFYTDTSILKTFISLKITTNRCIKNSFYIYLHKSKLEISIIIIGILLKEMNAIQKFLSINCVDLCIANVYGEKSNYPFFGYWVSQSCVNGGAVENFLEQISNIVQLEYDPKCCNEDQMLLYSIFDAEISSDIIYNSKVKFTDTNTNYDKSMIFSINYILNEFEKSSDIELMYWYQDSYLIIIIKRIFHLIREHPTRIDNDQILPRVTLNTINIINEINSEIAKNKQKFPRILVDSFMLLSKVNNIPIYDLEDYCKSMDHIILSDIRVDSRNYLNRILKQIRARIDDFKCFYRNFKYLSHEHNTYYIQFIENKSALLSINSINNNEIDKPEVTCNFVLTIYYKCYLILRTTNLNFSKFKGLINETTILEITKYMLVIINYSKNNDKHDFDLLRMAIDITIILLNLRSRKNMDVYRFRRILNVIMTDLNNYGIKYCTSSDFSFILFHNMKRIVSNDELNNYISTFYSHLFGVEVNSKIENIKTEDYNYLSIQYLYDTFIMKSEIFKLYGNSITVYWKGKRLTVIDIFEDAIFLTLNPLSLYALYDVYFKCEIAMVYYEISQVITRKYSNSLLDTLTDFQSTNFPQELEFIVKDINTYLTLLNTNIPTSETELTNEIPKIVIQIENQFRKFNIVFNKNTTCQSTERELATSETKKKNKPLDKITELFRKQKNSFNNTCQTTKQEIESKNNLFIINIELRDKVKEFNKHYSELRNIVGSFNNNV